MSIVNYLPLMPIEGSVVYAYNGDFAPDRAVFRDGKFIGGGEYPSPEYEMNFVSKWFYLNEYEDLQKGKSSYSISFDEAEKISKEQSFDITKHEWSDGILINDRLHGKSEELNLFCNYVDGEFSMDKKDAIAIANHFGLTAEDLK